MNRLISHGQAILSTLAFSLVIHFMPLAPSVLPDGSLGQATGLAARASRAAPPARTSDPCQPGSLPRPSWPRRGPGGLIRAACGLDAARGPQGKPAGPAPQREVIAGLDRAGDDQRGAERHLLHRPRHEKPKPPNRVP